MTDLPDINLWLALTLEDHPHHARAKIYWETERSRKLAFCRVTMLGYTRLLCNAHVMGCDPMTPTEAWKAYKSLISRNVIYLVQEPETTEEIMGLLISETGSLNAGMWTDPYLASLALASTYRIVSFDSDFHRFRDLNFHHLKS